MTALCCVSLCPAERRPAPSMPGIHPWLGNYERPLPSHTYIYTCAKASFQRPFVGCFWFHLSVSHLAAFALLCFLMSQPLLSLPLTISVYLFSLYSRRCFAFQWASLSLPLTNQSIFAFFACVHTLPPSLPSCSCFGSLFTSPGAPGQSCDRPYVGAGHDLRGATHYLGTRIKELHYALQCLIDYKGFRMTAQVKSLTLYMQNPGLLRGTASTG